MILYRQTKTEIPFSRNESDGGEISEVNCSFGCDCKYQPNVFEMIVYDNAIVEISVNEGKDIPDIKWIDIIAKDLPKYYSIMTANDIRINKKNILTWCRIYGEWVSENNFRVDDKTPNGLDQSELRKRINSRHSYIKSIEN